MTRSLDMAISRVEVNTRKSDLVARDLTKLLVSLNKPTKPLLEKLLEQILDHVTNGTSIWACEAAAAENTSMEAAVDLVSREVIESVGFHLAQDAVTDSSQRCAIKLKKKGCQHGTQPQVHDSFVAGTGKIGAGAISIFDMLDKRQTYDFFSAEKIIERYNTDRKDILGILDMLEKVEDIEDVSCPSQWPMIRDILNDGLRLVFQQQNDEDHEDHQEKRASGSKLAAHQLLPCRFADLHLRLFRSCSTSTIAVQGDIMINVLMVLLDLFQRHSFACATQSFSLGTAVEQALGHLIFVWHKMLVDIGHVLSLLPFEESDRIMLITFSLLGRMAPKKCESTKSSSDCLFVVPAHLLALLDPQAKWFSVWVKQVRPDRLLKHLLRTGLLHDILRRCSSVGRCLDFTEETALDASNLAVQFHVLRPRRDYPSHIVSSDLEDALFISSMTKLRCILGSAGAHFPFHRACVSNPTPLRSLHGLFADESAIAEDVHQDRYHCIDGECKTSRCRNDSDDVHIPRHDITPEICPSQEELMQVIYLFVSVLKLGITDSTSGVQKRLVAMCGETLEFVLTDTPFSLEVSAQIFHRIAFDLTADLRMDGRSTVEPTTREVIHLFSRALSNERWQTERSRCFGSVSTSHVHKLFDFVLVSLVESIDRSMHVEIQDSGKCELLGEYFDLVAALKPLLRDSNLENTRVKATLCSVAARLHATASRLGFNLQAAKLFATTFGASTEGVQLLVELSLLSTCVDIEVGEFIAVTECNSFQSLEELRYIILVMCGERDGAASFFKCSLSRQLCITLRQLRNGHVQGWNELCVKLENLASLALGVIGGPFSASMIDAEGSILKEIISAAVHVIATTSDRRLLAILWKVLEAATVNLDTMVYLLRDPSLQQFLDERNLTSEHSDAFGYDYATSIALRVVSRANGNLDSLSLSARRKQELRGHQGALSKCVVSRNISDANADIMSVIDGLYKYQHSNFANKVHTSLGYIMTPEHFCLTKLLPEGHAFSSSQLNGGLQIRRVASLGNMETSFADAAFQIIQSCYSRSGLHIDVPRRDDAEFCLLGWKEVDGCFVDWFSVCIFAICGGDVNSTNTFLDFLLLQPGTCFVWPCIIAEGTGNKTFPFTLHMVQTLMEIESPEILVALKECGCPLSSFVTVWLRQSFVGIIPFGEALLLQCIILTFGIDYQCYFIISILRHLQESIIVAAVGTSGGTELNENPLSVRNIEGFCVRSGINFAMGLCRKYRGQYMDALRQGFTSC